MEAETLGYCAVVKCHELKGVAVGPIQLNPEERLALDLYQDAVALSGFDSNGLPQINNLELAFSLKQVDALSEDEAFRLAERIKFIAARVRANEAAKLPRK